MHVIDYLVFAVYMFAVLGVGFYFYLKNKDATDYYVGNRSVKAHHVGLSIVATDVGGGFSIGLGGLGFVMGLSATWLLFTGLVGAWLAAVFLIPKVKRIDRAHNMMTYPDFLRFRLGNKVALLAAIISGIGYLGFTGAQVLAGAKLASATILPDMIWGMSSLQFALLAMGIIFVAYTVLGGLKAVIYTDTVQWIILLSGLIFLAIPFALVRIGGFRALAAEVPDGFLSLSNIGPVDFINWMVTIIPIWLIGMTLYQRMYACKDEREAKKAWYIAGFFEYPVMAFTGAFLGLCARVLFPDVDPEQGLPLLLKNVLPVGIAGLVAVSYFSAIMSTADSCLMASSGNFTNDILQRYFLGKVSDKHVIRVSQVVTLVIGATAIMMASRYNTVLDAIMTSYSFMVAGLFIPTMVAYFSRRPHPIAAFCSILSGGIFVLALELPAILFPEVKAVKMPFGLATSLFGISLSAITYLFCALLIPNSYTARNAAWSATEEG